MVDVFSPATGGKKTGPYATSSPIRQWGQPSTFNHIRLQPAREFDLTPCQAPLEELDLYSEKHPTWFFPAPPAQGHQEKSDFLLVNNARGYMYTPEGPSPVVTEVPHFWKPLADGAYVCGPRLAYRKGNMLVASEFEVDEEGFDAKVLPDGWTLVKVGPRADWSKFGSGQCGACPRAQLQIYSVSPKGEMAKELDIYEVIGNSIDSADLQISRDWQRATFYRRDANSSAWKSVSYCLQGHSYGECGESSHAVAPNPPVVKQLREDQ